MKENSVRHQHGSSPDWEAFAKGDQLALDRILTNHLPLVHMVARQLEPHLSEHVEHDDLVSAGTLGLMQAAHKFDLSKGLSFSTYAVPRIRGSMLDELRRQDYVPRGIRGRTRDTQQARQLLTHRLGRTPSSRELADSLGVNLHVLWRWEFESEGVKQISINLPVRGKLGKDASLIEQLLADPVDLPDEILNRKQEETELTRALLKYLNEAERTVLSLYFFEEMTLRGIGILLSISESRVSQVKERALEKLRGHLAHKVPS